MKRRDFVKAASLAGAGLLSAPAHGRLLLSDEDGRQFNPHTEAVVPSLDDLAGDWIPGAIFEQTPAVCNFHGGIQAGRNLLSISSFVQFPLAQGGELAQMFVDGEETVTQEYRWYAYQMMRRAKAQELQIVTSVRMPFESSGVLFRVDITSLSPHQRELELAITLTPTIREYSGTWYWDPPRPKEDESQEFDYSVVPSGNSKILLVKDSRSKSVVAFGFIQQPDEASLRGQRAKWRLSLKPGESRRIEFAMAAASGAGQVLSQIAAWTSTFTQVWEQAKENWQKRFLDAFQPNNGHFSGNLPVLATSDAKLRRLYYMSVLSLIALERTNLHPDYPRVFVTAAPRWAPTLTYFWDTSIYPTVLSLLDPIAAKQMIKLFLGKDIHSCYAIDIPTMKGVGPWYSANDYMVFQLATRYIFVTRDWRLLDEEIAGKKVIDRLEESALHWQKLVKDSLPLADYGEPDNLLETVPTYKQRVPAFNAANVWMMRTTAQLRMRAGNAGRAAELNRLADALATQVLTLYVAPKGYWSCLLDNGQRAEVRHCIDFFFAVTCMKDDLGPERLRQMIDFVNRELWTKDWLRALSEGDGAAKESLRPDHGSTGSFDAWPPLTVEAMFQAGYKEQALAHLLSTDHVTREGPFGQAHLVAGDGRPTMKAASMDYYEDSSAAFAEIMIRTLFGFTPGISEEWVWTAPDCPGLEGELIHLRYKGKLLRQKTGSK